MYKISKRNKQVVVKYLLSKSFLEDSCPAIGHTEVEMLYYHNHT